jgi:hypothetical protein
MCFCVACAHRSAVRPLPVCLPPVVCSSQQVPIAGVYYDTGLVPHEAQAHGQTQASKRSRPLRFAALCFVFIAFLIRDAFLRRPCVPIRHVPTAPSACCPLPAPHSYYAQDTCSVVHDSCYTQRRHMSRRGQASALVFLRFASLYCNIDVECVSALPVRTDPPSARCPVRLLPVACALQLVLATDVCYCT